MDASTAVIGAVAATEAVADARNFAAIGPRP